jgi:TnsA endonuclease N terminal
MRAAQQGRYILKNPSKYEGDPSQVIFRSSWERRFMIFLDGHSSVLSWSSEETIIPYFLQTDQKMHRYFPDFNVSMNTKNGVIRMMVEIKPFTQTQEPKRTGKKREKTFINEVETYIKNKAKWNAAEAFCKQKGWHFRIITEKELFNDKVW